MKAVKLLKHSWKWLVLLGLIVAIVDCSPLIDKSEGLNADSAHLARKSAKSLADSLASSNSKLQLNFNAADMRAIAATLSHLVPNTSVAMGYSPISLQAASSTQLGLGIADIYINVFCELSLAQNNSNIERCELGDLPVPGWMVDTLMYATLSIFFDQEVAGTVESLLANVSYSNKQLTVNANKSINFKERVNERIADASSLAKLAMQSKFPSKDTIQVYLNDIARQPKSNELMSYIRNTMQLAAVRASSNNPVAENKAAIWALAISLGSGNFAKYVNIQDYPSNPQTLLRQRRDLTLHFLYSAIIAQVGGTEFSLNTGELKEILDSAAGGSGFTFSDLAADNAGVAFSEALTRNVDSARKSQQVLMAMRAEDTFFPFIHDLADGLSQEKMSRLFTSTTSEQYKEYVDMINQRIDNSPLYAQTLNQNSQTLPYEFPRPNAISAGKWLTVDTHIHTKFSDGNYDVNVIAAQATQFGCDAIAITDHGEFTLDQKYFQAIDSAAFHNPRLTIIPGFEWNVPPFNGREHATVLFPQTANMKQHFQTFKQRFDHFETTERRFLDITPALQYLNSISFEHPVKPIMIYNHPSRKDNSPSENKHDLLIWQRLTPSVIGMSGAPGHQRNRANKNGSYEQKLKTINGLDPVTSIGGEWDLLLQRGMRTLAARAASDFHNLQLDYWPCEFSSTHTYAISNSHNSVLSALYAGNTWAQHGRFVQSLDLNLQVNEQQFVAGQRVTVLPNTAATLNLDITLAPKDWQGFNTSLDDLQLIIVTSNDVVSVPLLNKGTFSNNIFSLEYQLELPRNIKALRIMGRSVQPEIHDYPVFTNPIFFEVR